VPKVLFSIDVNQCLVRGKAVREPSHVPLSRSMRDAAPKSGLAEVTALEASLYMRISCCAVPIGQA
jgi:hypothetical protein